MLYFIYQFTNVLQRFLVQRICAVTHQKMDSFLKAASAIRYKCLIMWRNMSGTLIRVVRHPVKIKLSVQGASSFPLVVGSPRQVHNIMSHNLCSKYLWKICTVFIFIAAISVKLARKNTMHTVHLSVNLPQAAQLRPDELNGSHISYLCPPFCYS